MRTPDYLYHYTTVETLALILKNRNIKFNSLSNLDDKQEEKSDDELNFGKNIFVSSWTDEENESIPMWNMYADMQCGVRIKLQSNPFEKDQILQNFDFISSRRGFYSSFLVETMINQCKRFEECILMPVEYTDDYDKLNPRIFSIDISQKKVLIDMFKLGANKKKIWEFQREWRYILFLAPITYEDVTFNNKEISMEFFEDLVKKVGDNFKLSYSSCFLKLDNNIFKNMEITLSPKITEGNRIIVENLVENYNPTAVIRDSMLIDDIR